MLRIIMPRYTPCYTESYLHFCVAGFFFLFWLNHSIHSLLCKRHILEFRQTHWRWQLHLLICFCKFDSFHNNEVMPINACIGLCMIPNQSPMFVIFSLLSADLRRSFSSSSSFFFFSASCQATHSTRSLTRSKM